MPTRGCRWRAGDGPATDVTGAELAA